jgi:hypothetical protein
MDLAVAVWAERNTVIQPIRLVGSNYVVYFQERRAYSLDPAPLTSAGGPLQCLPPDRSIARNI